MFCVFVELGFVVVYVSTMVKDEIVDVENVGGIDEKIVMMWIWI